MFRFIAAFSIILTLCTMGLGVYLRLSGASLACPDWPGCYGQLLLPTDLAAMYEAVPSFPGQWLLFKQAWLQMTHRYLTLVLGFCVLLLFLMAGWAQRAKWVMLSISSALVLLMTLQAALGMWSVTLKVMPLIVLSHLLVAMLILCLLQRLYLQANPALGPPGRAIGPSGMARLAFWVLLLQIVLGGWLAAQHAGLACAGFPDCRGQWWPQIDYLKGFIPEVLLSERATLNVEARTGIHWLHRIGALVSTLVLLILCFKSLSARCQNKIRVAGFFLLLLLLSEVILGVLTVVQGLALWVTLAHSMVAFILVLLLGFIQFHATRLSFVADERVGTADAHTIRPESPVAEAELPARLDSDGLAARLRSQLHRTRGALSGLALGKKAIDSDLLAELEAQLLMADVGVDASREIMINLSQNLERNQLQDAEALMQALKENMLSILQPCHQPLQIEPREKPFVILVVGVNGVGKTTTIGKLAKRLQARHHSVMLAAGDTFRAAAVEQLQTWGERNQVPVVAQHTGADSASVIFDAIQSAKAKGVDVLIADTAGRLHTKSNLMDELTKVKRIMGKLDPDAPHEVLLVLDAGTGQNALSQARQFGEAVDLTGIALTKLDGTAKGGVIVALARQFGIPIRFIGVGEGIDDLQDFDAGRFIDALFS